MRTRVLSGAGGGGKGTAREVDHSPPCSAEVKNEWSNAPTSPICFHSVDRDSFIFLPLYEAQKQVLVSVGGLCRVNLLKPSGNFTYNQV
jgi:hypothetical protein